ncbi:MAG: hypothetical protein Q7R95_08925 [bacterium]|nr:hypothetical protein [bacterium]
MCFDGNTLAIQELKKFLLLEDDRDVIELFHEILNQAKLNKTGKFNSNLNYGVYQIDMDVNIFTKNDDGMKQYIDSELNSKIEALRGRLAIYYERYIQPKLFEYKLLK